MSSMWIRRYLAVQCVSSSAIFCRHKAMSIVSCHSSDVDSWNVAMSHSNKCQTSERTLSLFKQLTSQHPNIKPNFITYLLVLAACIRLSNLNEGKRVHEHIRQQCSTTVTSNDNIKVQTCLMQLYAKCGDIESGDHRTIVYRWPLFTD
jgi:hypothetical protein